MIGKGEVPTLDYIACKVLLKSFQQKYCFCPATYYYPASEWNMLTKYQLSSLTPCKQSKLGQTTIITMLLLLLLTVLSCPATS